MKVAVLSDIHDHIWNLDSVLKELNKIKPKAIIFCGDFCAPFIPPKLADLGIKVYACLGNNDEDHIGMVKNGGDNFVWTHLSQEYGEVILDNRKVAFNHYPKLAELQAKSGEYDAVFHGHTHVSRNKKYGKTILVNPGAVCGIQNGKPGKASYAVYNTKTNSAQIIILK